ncbi:Uncharacterised protein [Serratia odorifera]|uniref:Uncharacterized protein n=1 Tax=Serratia odorifera TaxID=618 RepID=A0A447KNI4_SEROD|nr:Uncharacterised protein [Serratia odorifera]
MVGVGVIQLNHFVLRQVFNFSSGLMMPTQDIRHRTGTLEVLLHQTQPFTSLVVVIRVQHLGQLGRLAALFLRLQELAVVKVAQVERMRMARLPQAQRLADAVTITEYRQIPGFAAQGQRRMPQFAAIGQFFQLATDADIHCQC